MLLKYYSLREIADLKKDLARRGYTYSQSMSEEGALKTLEQDDMFFMGWYGLLDATPPNISKAALPPASIFSARLNVNLPHLPRPNDTPSACLERLQALFRQERHIPSEVLRLNAVASLFEILLLQQQNGNALVDEASSLPPFYWSRNMFLRPRSQFDPHLDETLRKRILDPKNAHKILAESPESVLKTLELLVYWKTRTEHTAEYNERLEIVQQANSGAQRKVRNAEKSITAKARRAEKTVKMLQRLDDASTSWSWRDAWDLGTSTLSGAAMLFAWSARVHVACRVYNGITWTDPMVCSTFSQAIDYITGVLGTEIYWEMLAWGRVAHDFNMGVPFAIVTGALYILRYYLDGVWQRLLAALEQLADSAFYGLASKWPFPRRPTMTTTDDSPQTAEKTAPEDVDNTNDSREAAESADTKLPSVQQDVDNNNGGDDDNDDDDNDGSATSASPLATRLPAAKGEQSPISVDAYPQWSWFPPPLQHMTPANLPLDALPPKEITPALTEGSLPAALPPPPPTMPLIQYPVSYLNDTAAGPAGKSFPQWRLPPPPPSIDVSGTPLTGPETTKEEGWWALMPKLYNPFQQNDVPSSDARPRGQKTPVPTPKYPISYLNDTAAVPAGKSLPRRRPPPSPPPPSPPPPSAPPPPTMPLFQYPVSYLNDTAAGPAGKSLPRRRPPPSPLPPPPPSIDVSGTPLTRPETTKEEGWWTLLPKFYYPFQQNEVPSSDIRPLGQKTLVPTPKYPISYLNDTAAGPAGKSLPRRRPQPSIDVGGKLPSFVKTPKKYPVSYLNDTAPAGKSLPRRRQQPGTSPSDVRDKSPSAPRGETTRGEGLWKWMLTPYRPYEKNPAARKPGQSPLPPTPAKLPPFARHPMTPSTARITEMEPVSFALPVTPRPVESEFWKWIRPVAKRGKNLMDQAIQKLEDAPVLYHWGLEALSAALPTPKDITTGIQQITESVNEAEERRQQQKDDDHDIVMQAYPAIEALSAALPSPQDILDALPTATDITTGIQQITESVDEAEERRQRQIDEDHEIVMQVFVRESASVAKSLAEFAKKANSVRQEVEKVQSTVNANLVYVGSTIYMFPSVHKEQFGTRDAREMAGTILAIAYEKGYRQLTGDYVEDFKTFILDNLLYTNQEAPIDTIEQSVIAFRQRDNNVIADAYSRQLANWRFAETLPLQRNPAANVYENWRLFGGGLFRKVMFEPYVSYIFYQSSSSVSSVSTVGEPGSVDLLYATSMGKALGLEGPYTDQMQALVRYFNENHQNPMFTNASDETHFFNTMCAYSEMQELRDKLLSAVLNDMTLLVRTDIQRRLPGIANNPAGVGGVASTTLFETMGLVAQNTMVFSVAFGLLYRQVQTAVSTRRYLGAPSWNYPLNDVDEDNPLSVLTANPLKTLLVVQEVMEFASARGIQVDAAKLYTIIESLMAAGNNVSVNVLGAIADDDGPGLLGQELMDVMDRHGLRIGNKKSLLPKKTNERNDWESRLLEMTLHKVKKLLDEQTYLFSDKREGMDDIAVSVFVAATKSLLMLQREKVFDIYTASDDDFVNDLWDRYLIKVVGDTANSGRWQAYMDTRLQKLIDDVNFPKRNAEAFAAFNTTVRNFAAFYQRDRMVNGLVRDFVVEHKDAILRGTRVNDPIKLQKFMDMLFRERFMRYLNSVV